MTKFSMLLATALAAIAGPVSAATVYNNGTPFGGSGNEATAWVQSETFTLATATTIRGAGVYMSAFGGGGYDNGGLQYYIFANNAGTPGAILASGNVTPTVSATAFTTGGSFAVQLLTFNFASGFAAAANTVYHFGFHASGAGDFNRDEYYWVSTATNGTATGRESLNGTFNNWSDNGVEHAFYLTDAAIGGAVPEPATWALMIGGFGLVGGVMRRRSTKVSFA